MANFLIKLLGYGHLLTQAPFRLLGFLLGFAIIPFIDGIEDYDRLERYVARLIEWRRR